MKVTLGEFLLARQDGKEITPIHLERLAMKMTDCLESSGYVTLALPKFRTHE